LVGLDLAVLPRLGVLADALHHPLDLPSADDNAAGLRQVQLGFLVAGLIGPARQRIRANAGV
jgi:hypothetical protein